MAAPRATPADGPPSVTSTVAISDVDAAYKIILDVRGDESVDTGGNKLFPMEAAMPEKFSLSMSANWDTPFNKFNEALEGKVSGGGVPGAVGALLQSVGQTVKFKQASAQVWQSSSPMTFSIPFIFVAVNDPVKDVVAKVKALLKLVAPSEKAGGRLAAPGPTLGGQAIDAMGIAPDSRQVSISFGKFLRLSPAIITSVNADLDSIFGVSGAPMFAAVNVEVTSFYTSVTTQDIDKMFLM